MFSRRTSGILLHPTSFPGRFGIGDLGEAAYRFIDFLADSWQQVWQILPLGPTGYANSPYLSYSAFAGNPLLINLEWLASEGLLSEEDFANLPNFPEQTVDYDLAIAVKMPLLQKASQNFQRVASAERKAEFQQFCEAHAYWLDDYALFMALKETHKGQSWSQWDRAIAHREPQAIKNWTELLQSQIFYHKYLQAEFFRQWSSLRRYANEKGVQVFGDLPIYVAWDSADVWANRGIFVLDLKTDKPAMMAGVPPDYFSETGQLWGNPTYNWKQLEKTQFKWWIQRVEGMLDYVDIIRIDHFRGFEAFWAVLGGSTTAMKGKWVKAKGDEFFTLLAQELGDLPIVAEDLGVITPEVEALRDRFKLPGMKILHFAFDSDRANPFLPFNFTHRNCVVYTGTHDNNTTVGWFNARSPEDQQRVVDYLGCICPEGIHWSLIRLALSSVANCSIYPLQDLLGLGEEARMNLPGKAEGNWEWRYRFEELTPELRERLKYLTYLYGRAPY
ncbi:4-alpha-glucanotransferase [Lusitaniella coriacea LEGE 07157]|uniref:4-alpha-glucanotransferase n=1 Tax=Lusitaniella coriacea LEGE 07157 TaxID=945747 RepID=A0A8J7DYG4_9CYAN|nr:4-alpha-glucanotransferase [Lusitaniella coriacea]MBE9117567.1 4-alpha-glucanotransferase [Lusitaniella coriacea LEGE 07157]